MKAMLLCAGLGTRFRPITNSIAKPVIPFLNVPLAGFPLFYLEQLGLAQLVVNTHHLPKTVESTLNKITGMNYQTQFTFEEQILGSGGGIKNAEKFLTDESDFFVVNGDEILLFNHGDGFKPLLDYHKKSRALATLLTTDHPEAGKKLGGVWCEGDGRITQLGGSSDRAGAKHFTGVFVFSSKIFSYMPSGEDFHIFRDVLDQALRAGEKVLAFHDPSLQWLETSSEKDYLHSTREALKILSEKSVFTENLTAILNRFGQFFECAGDGRWLGAGAVFAGELSPGALLFMGANSYIGPSVKVDGFAVMGDGARFEQGFIDSSAIAPGTHVHPIVALRHQLLM